MAGPTDEVLDHEVLDELRLLADDDDPNFFADLIGTYLGELPGLTEAVVQAAEAGDGEQLRRAAHRLKGSSANIGAVALSAQCAELEQAASQGGQVAETLAQVNVLINATRAALEAVVAAG